VFGSATSTFLVQLATNADLPQPINSITAQLIKTTCTE